GVAVASFAVFLSDMVGGEFWRVSFIFGGVVGLIISIFARNIPESSEFLFNKAKDDVKPSFTILIFGILISGFIGGIYHFYMIFFKSYITDVTHLIESDLFGHILILGVILYILAAIISGYIADKFCEKKQIAFSLVVSIILAIANAIYMANGEVSGLLLVLSIFLIAFYSVPLQIILKRKMPIGNRLKLFSLSHSLGSLIFSSSSTLISTFIYDSTHLAFMPMFYLIAMMLVLGGVSFFCFRIPSLEC
nr:hypothetical protein [Rickettsiaceae bacterium]